MCSIVGYVGKKRSWEFVYEALSRLECRGYDAAGFACIDQQTQQLLGAKVVGPLHHLVQKVVSSGIDGSVGIGHTRWITRGQCVQHNAHPQFDTMRRVAVVYNGSLENYYALRAQLTRAGCACVSETEAELVAHVLAQALEKTQSLAEAVQLVIEELKGGYAFVALSAQYPDTIIAVRKGVSLCVGMGHEEYFVASEPLAFAGRTDRVLFLPAESFALITPTAISLFGLNGMPMTQRIEQVELAWEGACKGNFESYMLKEIFEQKQAIYATVAFYKTLYAKGNLYDAMGVDAGFIRELEALCLFACGTSWHAARIGQFFFEAIAQIPANVLLASELRLAPFFPHDHAMYIALSQSGETADVLEALRMMNGLELPTVALTNVPSSTLVREAGGLLLTKAGPEVAVASTKSFTCQLSLLYMLAHYVACERGLINNQQVEQAYLDVFAAAQALELVLEQYQHDMENIFGPRYASTYDRFLFVGRHVMYPFALEATLKFKELTYLFAQCVPAGELKHGAIALIDEQVPVVLFDHGDPAVYAKLVLHAQEIKAKGGHLIVVGMADHTELRQLADCYFEIPAVQPLLAPIVMTGVVQLFVYHIAKALGRPIDRPRNLAKSVTVA